MKRQDIQISDFRYICDYYEANIDYSPEYKKFVILRNISLLNDIAYDTDIYFLEKSLFEEIQQSGSDITDKVVFPMFNSNFGSFSKSYNDFSNILNSNNFKLIDDGGIVAPLTDKNGNYKNVQCDKIRIYHPYNKSDLKYIIYIDNYINGIHFHYFCNLNTNLSVHSETHIKLNNDVYSEFIEVYIPNLSFLYKENELYFNDIYNINMYADTCMPNNKGTRNWITTSSNINKYETYNLGDIDNMGSVIPLSIIINPFILQTNNDGINEKVYFKLNTYLFNNYSTFPVNILLYPYDVATYNNNHYLLNETYEQNADTFVNEYKFNIISTLEFDKTNHTVAIVNTFDFIDKYNEITNPTGKTIQEAYAEYNGLTLSEDKKTVKEYNGWYADEDDEYETDSEIMCCGFQIDVAMDYGFENIIYSDYQEMPYIDDFSFSLVHILDNWYNIPEILLIRIKYTDKYLGVGLTSDFIVLNKEWLKYIINSDEYDNRRLYIDFINKQNIITDMGWNKVSATTYNFNFIDKINCIINKEDNTASTVTGNSILGTKIIYKPIFYRTQELSTITFTSTLKQNIGINLAAYMTKVENFKLCIEDFELTETGRNDIYVIFNVNVNKLNSTTGKYYILDDDDNYISSGSWVINQ